jgi:uncharacterized protein
MNRILYLHGFASGPASAKAVFLAGFLSQAGAQVEVPDLAEGDFEHLTISGQLRVVERAAAGEPVSLIGSSMGGYLAALYAARHPEVQRMVLLAPAFGLLRRWMADWGAERLAEWKRLGSVEVFHYGAQRQLPLGYGLIGEAAAWEDEPAFSQPALIFHGSFDTVVPASVSQAFAAKRPNVRLEILDSDHELRDVLPVMAPRVRDFLL